MAGKAVPFHCLACGGENHVELMTIARTGWMKCAKCQRRLSAQDVMRARALLQRTTA